MKILSQIYLYPHPAPPRLEIVSHCWNYARIGSYQLSSLLLHPITIPVQYTLYYSATDKPTRLLVDFFSQQYAGNVTWCFRELEPSLLCRRSIGRNHAALHTEADWVWFADVDMAFGHKCLDEAVRCAERDPCVMCYPSIIRKSSHEIGDALVEAASGPPIIRPIDPLVFQLHVHKQAIGGVQIIKGDICREYGYLRDSPKYQEPADRWMRTYDDRYVRTVIGALGPVECIPELPVYRIAHSRQGRFTPGLVL